MKRTRGSLLNPSKMGAKESVDATGLLAWLLTVEAATDYGSEIGGVCRRINIEDGATTISFASIAIALVAVLRFSQGHCSNQFVVAGLVADALGLKLLIEPRIL